MSFRRLLIALFVAALATPSAAATTDSFREPEPLDGGASFATILFEEEVSFEEVTDALTTVEARIAAAAHTGPSNGFYRVAQAVEANRFFADYEALLSAPSSRVLVTGVRLGWPRA